MAHRVALSPPRVGAHYVSRWPGLGIPGAEIPTAGDSGASPLANDDISPASEYRLVIKGRPSAGKLTVYPDTSLLFEDAPAGPYSMIYEGFEDGHSYGEITDPLYLGAVDAAVSGGTGTSTGTGGGGSATGQISATVSGGTGTGTGSGTGGDATGGAGTSATATGGTGTSTGSGAGGSATGASADATAFGGIGTSTGSGTGGVAFGQGDVVPPGPLSHYVRPPRRVWYVKPTRRSWIIRPDKCTPKGEKMPLPTKDPAEIKTVTFDFSDDATEITAATITARTVAGINDTSSSDVIGAKNITGALVMQRVQAGVDGSSYGLRCVATDADGEVHVATALLPVKSADYV